LAAFLTNFGIGGLAPAFFILSREFDKSMDQTSHLLLYPILVLGAFNFFWVPIANYAGKRPVFVFASGLLCLCFVWGAIATSFNSLLWSNIIAAFAGSSTEALGAAIVNVSFLTPSVKPVRARAFVPGYWVTERLISKGKGDVSLATLCKKPGVRNVRKKSCISEECAN
jgi:MFS family permease